MDEELIPSWVSRYIVGESPTGSKGTNAIRDLGFASGMVPVIGGATDVLAQRLADSYDESAGREVAPRSSALDMAQIASGLIPIVIRKPVGTIAGALMRTMGNSADKAGTRVVLRNPSAVKLALSKANSMAQPKSAGNQIFIAEAKPVDKSVGNVLQYTLGKTPKMKDTYQFRGPMQGKNEWANAGGAFGEIKPTGNTKTLSNGSIVAEGSDGNWYKTSTNAEGEPRQILTVSGEDAAKALDLADENAFGGTITKGAKSERTSTGVTHSKTGEGATAEQARTGTGTTTKDGGTTVNKANLAAQALSRSAPAAVSDWAQRKAINDVGGLTTAQLTGMTATQGAVNSAANYLKERQLESDLRAARVSPLNKYEWPENYHNYVEQLMAGFKRNPQDYEIDSDIANTIQQYLNSKEWLNKHLRGGQSFPDFNEVFK